MCAGLRPASYHQLSGMSYKAVQEFSQAQLHLCKARCIDPSDWEGVLIADTLVILLSSSDAQFVLL